MDIRSAIQAQNTKAKEGTPLDDGWTELRLQHHQLTAVHSMVKRMFTPTVSGKKSGFIISDEVGLGKTGQALGLIAFIAHLKLLSDNKLAFPKICGECIST